MLGAIDEIRALPSHGVEQQMGHGPAHGRGEAARKRKRGDGASCPGPKDTTERSKGRIVQGCSGRDAEQHPDREISGGMGGIDDQGETKRGEERADGHDPMSTVAVDQQAHAWRHEAGREQREREAAHGKAHRPAALVRDQRHGQDRRIEDCAPGQNLGDAEHEHGAPGAGDHIAQSGHDRSTVGEIDSTLSRPVPWSI